MVKNRKTDGGTMDRKEIVRSWGRTLIMASAIIIFIVAISFICLSNCTRHGERFTLPSLAGMTLEEARRATEEMDVEFDILDSLYIPSMNPGVILDQYPKAGNFVKSGRRITITTNTYAPKSVKVPYVTGYSLRQAKNRLMSSGLQISRIIYEPDIATNYVLKQVYKGRIITPNSELEVPVNSGIELYVGTGESQTELKVPNVLGELLYNAKNRLWEEGINVDVYQGDDVKKEYLERAFVYRQYPSVGESIAYGENVELYVTLDSLKVKRAISDASAQIEELTMLRDKMSKLNDTLSMYDSPDFVVIDENRLVNQTTLDTMVASPKYVIELNMAELKFKLDSLKRK